MNYCIDRRALLKAGVAGAVAVATAGLPLDAFAKPVPIRTRRIPRSGERLPIIGTGSAGVYGFDPAKEPVRFADCRTVLETLIYGGGKVIDTAADYGLAEEALGLIMVQADIRKKLFISTKVGKKATVAEALADMRRSHERMQITHSDMLQLHDVEDPNTDLAFLRDWKAQGRTRYTGISTMFPTAYDAIYATLLREKPDFLQINLAIDDRLVEQRILPAAADHGVAVIINSPFGNGRVFKAVQGRPLPPWAIEFDATTWAQFFLKFILANPAVTCVIPGTATPAHMMDNLEAGRGRLPDARQRQRMIRYWEEIGAPTVS